MDGMLVVLLAYVGLIGCTLIIGALALDAVGE